MTDIRGGLAMIRRIIILALVMWAAHASAAAVFTAGGALLNVGGALLDVGTPAPTLPVCRWNIDRWNATTCTWGS